MAQDKRVFTGGMDKDSDPRLIKNGDYRDALNIRNISSSDSTSGSVENIEGNTLVPYSFVTENNEFYEVTVTSGDGIDPSDSLGHIVEVEESSVLFSQTLTISGKEVPHCPFNLSISYPNASGFNISPLSGNLNWNGSGSQSVTSTILYDAFGPGGPLSVLNLYDINTGVPILVTASIDFSSGDILNGNNFNITFSCATPGAVFELSFSSSYDDVTGETSITEMSEDSLTQIPINELNTAFISGSVSYEEVGPGVNPTSGEDDNEITFGPGVVSNNGTVVDLTIEGDSPTDPSVNVTSDFDLFSWDQVGGSAPYDTSIVTEDNFIVTKVIDFQSEIDSLGSGGEFEFNASQNSFSSLITKLIDENNVGDVFVVGTGGTKSSIGSLTTNFTSNTKLEAKDSGATRNGVNDVSYTQLEYFYNSDEILASNGWSINQGTITFDGSATGFGGPFSFKSPILGSKNYKLTFNVSGLPSGNSFSVKIHDQDYGLVQSDGNQEIFLENVPNDASYVYIDFSSDFATSDTMTITNARLFLEDVPVNKLSVRIKSSGSTKFNLAFAASESQLKSDLASGSVSSRVVEWFPGVSLNLETLNSGVIDENPVDQAYEELLGEFQASQLEVVSLLSDIESLTSTYDAEILRLDNLLSISNSSLAEVQSDLAALGLANSTLIKEKEQLENNYSNLQDIITSFINGEVDATSVLDVYSATHTEIQNALDTISTSIANISSENINNLDLQNQLNNLQSQNDSLNIKIADLESQIQSQSNAILELNVVIRDQKESLSSNTDKIRVLEARIENLVKGAAEDYITIGNLLREVESLRHNLALQAQELTIALANQEDGVTQADVDAVQSQLEAAELQISELEIKLQNAEAVTTEDGITQADLDIAYIESQQVLQEIKDDYDQQIINLNTSLSNALANEEDGITQADLDEMQGTIDSLNETIDSIQEQQDTEEVEVINQSLVEHISNGTFRGNSDWLGTNWQFDDGVALVNDKIYGQPNDLTQNISPKISKGNYILSLDCIELTEGSFDVITVSSNNQRYLSENHFTVNGKGNFLKRIFLNDGVDRIIIRPSKNVNLSIDNVSLTSISSASGVTLKAINNLLLFINNLSSKNDTLLEENSNLRSIVLNLTSQLNQATTTIQEYESELNNIITSFSLLSSSLNDAIEELSLTSTIDQAYIDDFTSNFNNQNSSLNEQYSELVGLIQYLTSQLDSKESTNSSASSSYNDKWTFTVSGGQPVSNNYSLIENMPLYDLRIKNNFIPNFNQADNVDGYSLGLLFDPLISMNFKREKLPLEIQWIGGHPLLTFIQTANIKNGRTIYNNDFKKISDGSFFESPESIIFNIEDEDAGLITIKFTSHNIPVENVLVNSSGSIWQEGDGDKYVKDQGNTPLVENTGWLASQGVINGLQFSFEILSNHQGFEFYLKDTLNNSGIINLSSNSVTSLAQDSSRSYSWNIDSIDNTQSLDVKLAFEQVQVSSSQPLNRSLESSVEKFVSSAMSNNYSLESLQSSSNLVYPSESSDIILNKSQDLPPVIPTILSSAKRFVRNTILNKTTVTDNSSDNFICIGSYEDKPKSNIYYFVLDTTGRLDCILEYSLVDDLVSTVYQDGRFNSYGLESDSILNFNKNSNITGISKIDDILYWTDNLNRPRKINVKLAKKNEINIKNAVKTKDAYFVYTGGSAYLSFDSLSTFSIGDSVFAQVGDQNTISFNGYSEVVGICRKMPEELTFNITNGDPDIVSSFALSNNQLIPGQWIGVMDNEGFPRFYRVESKSGTTITVNVPPNFANSSANPLQWIDGQNIGALITDNPFQSGGQASGVIMQANPDDAYSPIISFGNYDDKRQYLDAVKIQPTYRPNTVLDLDSSYAKNNILDSLFQFKYRYIHHDNENTSYSPISNINIDPEFARNTPINFTEYLDVANTILVDYDDSISDVKKIEIVARKGNDGEFVLVDTVQNVFVKYLKKRKNEILTEAGVDISNLYDEEKSYIKFRNNGVYPFVDKSDSDKLFDSVPKLAKAQTILSNNRLAYGNILEGYDNTPLVLSSEFTEDNFDSVESTKTSISVFADSSSSLPITNFLGNDNSAKNSNLADAIVENPSSSQNQSLNTSVWGGNGGENCKVNFYLDLSNLNFNDEDSQTVAIDLGFQLTRASDDGDFSNTFKRRSAKLSMNVDITGLATINEVRNRIKNKFNQGAYSGGLDINAESFNSLNSNDGNIYVDNFGATKIRVRFSFNDNNTSNENGNWTFGWDNEYNGWRRVKIVSNINLISGSPGLNSFKSGAFHDFGIAYFDETNRCSFVNVAPDFGPAVELQEAYNTSSIETSLNGSRPYNPFVTESDGVIGQSLGVEFCIYNKPPNWATHYQFFYAGNTSVDEFMQVTIPIAVAGEGNDTQMYLSLQSLKNHKSSYTESTNALIDFDIAEGDRIRFISCESGGLRRKFTEYLDFEITGFDLYSEVADASANGNPIDIAAGQEGFYIRIGNPGSELVGLENTSDVSIDHSGFSLGSSGYNKLIAEIYRPKKTQDPENLVYYELGDKKEIGGSGNQNYHSGDVNQTPEYFYDKDVDTFVSLTPAKVTIREGDTYIKNRNMFTQANGASLEGFICEDYFLNDFHRTNHYDKGRVNVVNNNSAERRLDASVYYSESYVSTGAINGLSNFNLANIPYFDYNKDFGSIQYLGNNDNDLIIFHESKVGRVLVGKDILNTASGTGLVSLSNDIIGDYVKLYTGNFGCGLHPESIVNHNHKFYFVDIKRGVILRLSTDGLTTISEYGMKDYFRDIGEMYVKYDPDNIGNSGVDKTSTYSIVGGYDPKYDEYVITLPEIATRPSDSTTSAEPGVWDQSITNWDNLVTNNNQLTGTNVVLFNAITVAFSEEVNKWSSFYSFIPEYYAKINKQFVTFKQGRLYRHNSSDLYSRNFKNFNEFYGNNHLSYIDFVFNAEPSSVKSYNAIGLESDTKFITGMFSNMGQHYGGYKDVITTSIGFKKVGGTVSCTSTSSDPTNVITGIDTEFYSDVAPGDLIRITTTKGNNVANLIIDKVVSNTRILTIENVPFSVTDTFMLVIDYKTKEGIHYADIPFCISGVDSLNDNTYHGDGSEIIGLGLSTNIITNASGNVFATLYNTSANSFDTNVDLNKKQFPSDSIVGASYVITNINVDGTSDLTGVSIGDLFVYDTYLSNNDTKLLSTECKMYVKEADGATTFLGYPYSFSNNSYDSEINFILEPSLQGTSLDEIPANGYVFLVKDGRVEGERMKGSYMRTVLATNSQQSKSKFNLYAANADVDKSELSNR